ncbi:Piso0_003982 [Millerozyma farinosa CBS 7064]|uniref:Piso0_003982 protein n=1 Tax=Pichia sorbitophila (strain ATCC MYA-4447 / BCRC 22081 / CBS 7064 / NBRC 10061 / NRRL Y-12695) TaxID=559304 RepID=G8YA24_PICSO|nr:Piso0_003982 [Millerozyma farinosa CBS 7064]CCE84438.1 Piso0_003982 [Millerozyma farinosa CBS 7064]
MGGRGHPLQGSTHYLSSFLPEMPEAPYSALRNHLNVSNLAPARILNSLLSEEDAEIERVEHFKYKQDLERKLTVSSVIGLGFGIMGVVFGISSTIWISLIDGANATILYGWLVTAFFSVLVVLSLSEIISKYPTAGGVYHFSAILSSENYSLLSSWFTGWFLIIGNWTYSVSIMFAGSRFILSIFGLSDSYYKEDVFLVLGVYFIILTFCGLVNFKLAKYLELINRICIYWSIGTVVIVDILLIFFAKKTNTAKQILTAFDNTRSGYPDPIAFFIGLQSPCFTLSGYGMLFSMTDEVKKPEKNMPKGALYAILLASFTGLIFIIPVLVILPELTLLLDQTPEIMPIDLIFKFATESYVVSFLLVLLLIGTVLFQAIASLTTSSRTTYAFARDGGLPLKEYWVEVDSVEESTIPKNALFLSMGACAILSLLSLLSTSAFNAFIGSSVISLGLANGIPILCLMLNKRQKIKGAAFRLRKFGWLVNGLSIGWVILSSVILCFPPVIKHLTWISMNYAAAVICGFIGFAALGYVTWGSGNFEGPKIDTDYFELHNLEASGLGGVTSASDFAVGDDDTHDADEEENNEEELNEGETLFDASENSISANKMSY